MSEALVIWMFMLLIQQDGMGVGAASSRADCEERQVQAVAEARALGQHIIAMSECQAVTLNPVKEG